MADLVRVNAEKDPTYAPYCLRAGCWRMVVIARFFWRCPTCGAEHDERTPHP